mgnify:CR=1 FL=1
MAAIKQMLGHNAEAIVKGNKLIITVDLGGTTVPSKPDEATGLSKQDMLAKLHCQIAGGNGYKIGLNIMRKVGYKAPVVKMPSADQVALYMASLKG